MKIIDTHCHLNDERCYPIVKEILTRATAVGVTTIVNNGDSLESFERILQLQKDYPEICKCVLGIHPEYADKNEDYFLSSYQKIEEHQKEILAVGEIGLDYHYTKDKDIVQKQKNRFIEQIRFSKKLHLPIVVHARDADRDTFDIIKAERPEKVDLHCYSGSAELLKEYLRLGLDFHIGIGGVCTFKNARVIQEVISIAPLSVLMTETDAPYLAPVPHRGEMNESTYIPLIIAKIAEIKNMDKEEVAKILYHNGRTFYGLD